MTPDEARRFHDESLVFLAYTVTPVRLTRQGASLRHMAEWLDGPRVDLPKLKQGGVDAVFLSVGSESLLVESVSNAIWATQPPQKRLMRPVWSGAAAVKRILWGIDALHEMMAANSDVIELALGAADVERIVAKGKIAGIIHVTRGDIDDDLAMLRTYWRNGVRAMQIAYDDGRPGWVDACSYPPVAHGLTDFGRDVVREMNRLGMLIDLAHASDAAYAAVLEVSSQPVISSHSGSRALCNVWRNLSDDTFRALAAKRSLVGAFFGSGYLDERYWDQPAAHIFREQAYRRQAALAAQTWDDPLDLALALRSPAPSDEPPPPLPQTSPLSVLLDHIDHSVQLMGEDYVCLGSDFGGIDSDGVAGLDEPSKLPNLTAALLERGYLPTTVRKILGTNLLRLFREVVGS